MQLKPKPAPKPAELEVVNPDKKGSALATVQNFTYTPPDKSKTTQKEKISLLNDKQAEKTVTPRSLKKPARVFTEPQEEDIRYFQIWAAKQQLQIEHYLKELNILIADNFNNGEWDYSAPMKSEN